jgi:hypothetical protein
MSDKLLDPIRYRLPEDLNEMLGARHDSYVSGATYDALAKHLATALQEITDLRTVLDIMMRWGDAKFRRDVCDPQVECVEDSPMGAVRKALKSVRQAHAQQRPERCTDRGWCDDEAACLAAHRCLYATPDAEARYRSAAEAQRQKS